MIVIKPVRVNEEGSISKANYIITGSLRIEDAIKEAIEISGLGKFNSWNFLFYGELSSGRIKKDGKFNSQVRRIVRSSINKRKNGSN